MNLTIIQKIAIWAIPLIFAITLHEVAHGFVASRFGDQTARLSGRLTINPLKHIDLVGTIIVPLLMLMSTNFIFGWAKPVPVDPRNLHHPRRDMAFVAIAGPVTNLLMCVFWALVARAGMSMEHTGFGVPLALMGEAGIGINIVLAVLNLLPIPPLDGSKVLNSLLPPRIAYKFNQIEPYSFLILILLLVTGVLSWIMMPIISFLFRLVTQIFLS